MALNTTLYSNYTTTNNVITVQLYQIVLGCLTFFLVLPFVLFHFHRFPIGSTGAVLTGAMLMVICTVLSQDTVYTIIGDKNNLKTIFLLWGMMMISQYFEREKLIDYLLNILFRPGLHFIGCLFRLSIIDACLSALFTNDVACVILTPLILTKWTEQKRDIHELNTLLLCLATMANIGKRML
ncbi:unnamed protein product [Didymodactylos carnosus]|uniref:Citrate transporter-like domain-containing protein n=1 Tax=Didymodactylos carnosus TaxID=1234261 RepID=A0A8S2F8D2_9BILA|nr:unnamed protein product [Didymodactylos carnosus]CAF4192924.1 unnamed protein product [Didymodactylos carnosus]